MAYINTAPTVFGVGRLTLLVTGNIVGSGIFLLPSALAQYGSIGLLAWAFTAMGGLVLAWVFAELSAVLPSSSGFYAHCRDAFGDFVGFQVAYSYWTALWVGNAALVVALTGYISVFIPILHDNQLIAFLVNVSTIWIFTGLTIVYFKGMFLLQTIATLVKLLPLLVITIIGLSFLKLENFKAFTLVNASPIASFSEAAAMTLWSFLGLESASLSARHAVNPKRDIPRATVWGFMLAAVLYISSYIAIIGIIPFSKLMHSAAPYAQVMQPLFGVWASQSIAVLSIISCMGSLAGWILLQGQMPLLAAKDRLFPPVFLKENADKVPVSGLVISSCLITGLLLLQINQNLVEQFKFIVVLATLVSLIPYFFTSMAVIILVKKYRKDFQLRRSLYRFVLMSMVGGVYTFWCIFGAGPTIVFYSFLVLLSSVPVYVWLQWRLPAS